MFRSRNPFETEGCDVLVHIESANVTPRAPKVSARSNNFFSSAFRSSFTQRNSTNITSIHNIEEHATSTSTCATPIRRNKSISPYDDGDESNSTSLSNHPLLGMPDIISGESPDSVPVTPSPTRASSFLLKQRPRLFSETSCDKNVLESASIASNDYEPGLEFSDSLQDSNHSSWTNDDDCSKAKLRVSPGGLLTFQLSQEDDGGGGGGGVITDKDSPRDSSASVLENESLSLEKESVVPAMQLNPQTGDSVSTFELIPTGLQSHKDCLEKEKSNIRMACLEVAAESYKSANLDVPDVILAQINEARSRKLSIENEPKKDIQKLQLTPKEMKEVTPHIPKKVKQIILSNDDEIHVSPCQCALSLVGMRGTESFSNVESMFGFPFFGDSLNENHGSDEDSCSSLNNEDTYSLDGNEGKKLHRRNSLSTSTSKSEQPTLVRTSSAIVSNMRKEVKATKVITKVPITHTKKKRAKHNINGSTVFQSFGYHEIILIRCRSHLNKPTVSVTDEVLDWDAVTIRCRDHDEMDAMIKSIKDASLATVVPFSSNPKRKRKKLNIHNRDEGIALRNMSHSYCPTITRARNDTRRASSLPRKLGTSPTINKINSISSIDENAELSATFNENNHESDRLLRSPLGVSEDISDEYINQSDGSQFWGIFRNRAEDVINPSGIVDTLQQRFETPAVENESNGKKNMPSVELNNDRRGKEHKREKSYPWDFHFNKKEYCELCALPFTLLTRRHHCRQCSCSCCGHCSSLMLVSGGDEKRYCNKCSAKTLQEQSNFLLKPFSKMKTNNTLPGKVHSACKKLGVGYLGKLPHWRNYLYIERDKRPAVGRISIELIEAIALPNVDFVNGMVDPYVRATISGYDRDMLWTLREWLPAYQYTLSGSYCVATLSPVWVGSGWKGGELLTLPVICTAGAVLRLEVLHYNVLTNARGKDTVLGMVEIPLSDLPNANLRYQPASFTFRQRKGLKFDGYCDRWYRLLPRDSGRRNEIFLSQPIESPHSTKMPSEKETSWKKSGKQSLDEIGKRIQGVFVAPVEWFASAIKLDLPARQPEVICAEHKSRSMIHVRIKLNASEFGDLMSHVWFPLVKPRPALPNFDPQILFDRFSLVSKLTKPYQKIFRFVEKAIKWEHEEYSTCTKAYLIFAMHLIFIQHLLPLLHLYLIVFLNNQLSRMEESEVVEVISVARSESFESVDAFNTDKGNEDLHLSPPRQNLGDKEEGEENLDFAQSPSLVDLKQNVLILNRKQEDDDSLLQTQKNSKEGEKDETAKLHIAVRWLAHRYGSNKGLEKAQHKLGRLACDLKDLNQVWDGSNPLLTRAVIVYLCVSLLLHFVVNRRLLWLMGTFMAYFARSPIAIHFARSSLGFWRGVAKITRRQHLLDSEILKSLSGS